MSVEVINHEIRFGGISIPLAQATAFWITDKKEHQIVVFCHNKALHTSFRLFLETRENMHRTIKTLMNQTNLVPSLLQFRSVTPYTFPVSQDLFQYEDIPLDQESASIDFEMGSSEELEYFTTYYFPKISSVSDMKILPGTNTVRILVKEIDTHDNQVRTINRIFNTFRQSFSGTGITELLQRKKKEFL